MSDPVKCAAKEFGCFADVTSECSEGCEVARLINAAIAAEREACARIAYQEASIYGTDYEAASCLRIAAAIRARGTT